MRKRKSRRPRTQILLTMINMFLNVIASKGVLGNGITSLSYAARLLVTIARAQNDKVILELYLLQVFFTEVKF